MKILKEGPMDPLGILDGIGEVNDMLNQLQIKMQDCDLMTQSRWNCFNSLRAELKKVRSFILNYM